jgi:hypothetical protein
MRKLFWCCTAVGVVFGTGVFAGVRYAAHHPKLILARGVISACAAIPVAPGSLFPWTCPAQPSEATPDPVASCAPVIRAEFLTPSRTPAPIVIQEDDLPAVDASEEQDSGGPADHGPCPAALCPPATAEASQLHGPVPADYAEEHAPTCRTVMPYCTDDEADAMSKPHMPYAEELSAPERPHSFWMGLLEGPHQGALAPCQEDGHSFEHYSGCPYIAPSKTDRRPKPPVPAVAPPRRSGQDECSDEPVPTPKVHKVKYQGGPPSREDCPRHPEVDTMEYRKSDGGLHEYGPGPY